MALLVKDANGVNQALPSFIDPTYSAAENAITAVTSATDQLQLTGAAGIIGRVKHVEVYFVPGIATAASQVCQLVRRSTAASGAGGTTTVSTTTATLAKHNIGLAAPSCTLARFTGTAPTAGTAAGIIRSDALYAAAATVASTPTVWDFSTRNDRPPDVSSASDFICVSFGGVTQGNTWGYHFEWEEGTL